MDSIIIEITEQTPYFVSFTVKNCFIGECNAIRRILYDHIVGYCLTADKIITHEISTIIEDFTKEIELIPVKSEALKGKDITKFRYKFSDKNKTDKYYHISTGAFKWFYDEKIINEKIIDEKIIDEIIPDDFVFYGLNPNDSLTFEGGITSGIGKEHARFSQVKHINYKPIKIKKQYHSVDLYDCYMGFTTYQTKTTDDIMKEIFEIIKSILTDFRVKIKSENDPTIEKQIISDDDMKITVKNQDATLGGLIVPNILIQEKGIFIGFKPVYYGKDDLEFRIGSIDQQIIEEGIENELKRINSIKTIIKKGKEKKEKGKEKEKKEKKEKKKIK